MLKKAVLTKQISITLDNKIGVLNIMSGYLADRGINIEAVAGYEMEESKQAKIMLVVDDTRRAIDALNERGFGSVEEKDVVMVELDNKPGALKNVTSLLANQGINIRYIYATTSPDESPVRVVISTSDNEKSFVTLKKSTTA
ncbi:MAG: ACT domain-containing protein [Deltaproteobacteria bacterium]|nr:ACT domain-containing protein [Deltaproteobacteria bacterium]